MEGLTIAQLAAHTGLAVDTIRYYLRIGLVPEPPRGPDNARRFPAETLDRLAAVKRAQRLGLALADIKRLLDVQDAGRCPCAIARRLLGQRLDDLDTDIAALTRQRNDVAVVLTDPTALHAEGRLMTRDEPTRHSRRPRGKRARADSGLRRPALAHLAASPTHAYAVWRHLVSQGHASPTSPRHVYRILARLEADGLVTSHWDLSGPGPGRRVYTITRQGRDSLDH